MNLRRRTTDGLSFHYWGWAARIIFPVPCVRRGGICLDIPFYRTSPFIERDYRNVWSAAELQAKNERWQLVCANVFGLQWSR
jgi:hypothetical protein